MRIYDTDAVQNTENYDTYVLGYYTDEKDKTGIVVNKSKK